MSQPISANATITIPLNCIVDVVNNVYVFSELAQSIGAEFAQQFRISRKIADSGTWWRTCYGLWFHAAIKQIVLRADEIPTCTAHGTPAQIDAREAHKYLPCVEVVQEILALWHNPDQTEAQRKAAVLAFFPPDVRRIIEPADDQPVLTQFHEEGYAQRGRAVLSFFAYLDQCSLPADRDGPIALQQAVQYWGWIDNVKAFRTFFREEAVRNVRTRRMQQAVQLARLVERVKSVTGVDLSAIEIAAGEQLFGFLQAVNFAHVAIVAESYGLNPLIDIDQNIFIRHTSLGAAIDELVGYLPLDAQTTADDPALYSQILRASAENILNHDLLLDRISLVAANGLPLDYRAVHQRLMHLADTLETTLRCYADEPCRPETLSEWLDRAWPAISWSEWSATLSDAKAIIDRIAAEDVYSRRSTVGLDLLLAQVELLTAV